MLVNVSICEWWANNRFYDVINYFSTPLFPSSLLSLSFSLSLFLSLFISLFLSFLLSFSLSLSPPFSFTNLGESNYHIFYYMLAGLGQPRRQELGLKTPSSHRYLSGMWSAPCPCASLILAFIGNGSVTDSDIFLQYNSEKYVQVYLCVPVFVFIYFHIYSRTENVNYYK